MLLGRIVRLRGRPTRIIVDNHQWHAAPFHTSRAVWGKVLRTFKLADIGEGITECEIIKWCVVFGVAELASRLTVWSCLVEQERETFQLSSCVRLAMRSSE